MVCVALLPDVSGTSAISSHLLLAVMGGAKFCF